MKIVGAIAKTYQDADEASHPPGPEDNWQESVVLHWYDSGRGIGGFHRIGHEPNRPGGGIAVLWSYVFTTGGIRYRRFDSDIPLSRSDWRKDGFTGGPTHSFWFDGRSRWQIRDENIAVDLACENFFGLLGLSEEKASDLRDRYARDHFEAAGPVTGHARIGNETFEISGYGYRDHSWGPRFWNVGMLSHRWFTGTFGPDLSFLGLTWHAGDGSLERHGFIAERGLIQYTHDVDIVVHIEPDGLTHRGGHASFGLPDGRRIDITAKAISGAVFERGLLACVETICEARCGDLVGYCDLEISNNARAGMGPILLSLNAMSEDGLTMPVI